MDDLPLPIIGELGRRRVVLTAAVDLAKAVQVLQRMADDGEKLRVTVGGTFKHSLSFLADLPFLEHLAINRWTGKDISPVGWCKNLKTLYLSDAYGGFDFSQLPQLEVFYADEWSGKWVGLKDLPMLHLLRLRGVRAKTVEAIALPPSLRNLHLQQTSLESLEGLEDLQDLCSISLAHCRSLREVSQIARIPSVQRLQVHSLKNVSSFAWIGECKNLIDIDLVKCSSLPTLKWLKSLEFLRLFGLIDTQVDDHDLTPLLEAPSLLWVTVRPKLSFSPPSKEVNMHFEKMRRQLGLLTPYEAKLVGNLPEGVKVGESDWAGTSHLD